MFRDVVRLVVVGLTVLVFSAGVQAELFLHLDGSTTDSSDPNIAFKDLAKGNHLMPTDVLSGEMGLGVVYGVSQHSFGAVGDVSMGFTSSYARASSIEATHPDFNRSYTALTIALWYQPATDNDGENIRHNFIMGKMGGSGNRGWSIERADDDDQMTFTYFDGPSGVNHAYGLFPVNGTGALASDFRHIVITFEANTSVKIYGDGMLLRDLPALSAVNGQNSSLFQVGNRGDYTKDSAGGLLDDVAMWDEVIPARRIAAIHALGRFEDLDLQDPGIDAFLAAFDAQGSVNIGCHVWTYATGLSGALGTPDGTVANCNASVVLDGSGNGMVLTSCGAAIDSDLNHDCVVDFGDFAILASQWLDSHLP